MKTEKQNKPLLWIARIWAGLFLVSLLFLGISEFLKEVRGGSSSPLVTLFGGNFLFWLPWIIAAVGYVVAYFHELVGGGISFISFLVGFYPYDFIGNDYILVTLTVTPSVLYLIWWWFEYRYRMLQRVSDTGAKV